MYTAQRADSTISQTPHRNQTLACIPNPYTPHPSLLILIIPAVRSRPHSSTTVRRAASPPLLTGQRLMWNDYTAPPGVTKYLSPLVATTARRCRPVKNYHNYTKYCFDEHGIVGSLDRCKRSLLGGPLASLSRSMYSYCLF